jgi:protein required for attachment to host cells
MHKPDGGGVMAQQTWVMIANGSEAKVFNYEKGEGVDLIQSFSHPESRTKGSNLASDRAGHTQSHGGGHGSYTPASDPKEYEFERFAHELCEFLEMGRRSNQCSGLILAAPPQFLGLLRKNISTQTSEMIRECLDKDYTQLTELELQQRLGLH